MVNVLDDIGYVKFIEPWGSDERIIEAARMSTAKGFLGWTKSCDKCDGAGTVALQFPDDGKDYRGNPTCPMCNGTGEVEGDSKLLRYLYTNKHFTPFEMAGMIIEVQAPIMVFREWHRHRTQSYNEMSGRYTELPNLFYIPSVERLKAGKQSQVNKQGSEGGFSDAEARIVQNLMKGASESARDQYESLLSLGVSRELARLVLPVNQYSRMRASANLRNWLAFLELRTAPGAQWEIRQYANEVAKLVEQNFPRTYELWNCGNK